jgi:hypothetical protein
VRAEGAQANRTTIEDAHLPQSMCELDQTFGNGGLRHHSPNYNSTKLRFVYFGLIEEGLWIKRKHEFFVARI